MIFQLNGKMTIRTTILWTVSFLFLISCAQTRPMWNATIVPTDGAVKAALSQDPTYPYRRDIDPEVLPQFNPPERLRPCCVFGMDVKVSMVKIPIPIYQLVNVTEVDKIGPHTYDAGFFGGQGTDKSVGTNEKNGLVYTCRGGFIDTAHVRDYSDMTIFLFFEFFRNMGNHFDIELKGELGPRVITVDPVEIQGGKLERVRVASLMAAWTAYQLSLWHEIAQWHGYSEFSMFSEQPSAYSLEDAYSNMVGINLACGLIYSSLLFTDNQYARNFDIWLQRTLMWLGAVPESECRQYMNAVDQLWWDSNERLPEKFIVLKRNYNMATVQTPNLVSEAAAVSQPAGVSCTDGVKPERITVRDRIYDRPISDWVHIAFSVGEKYRPSFSSEAAFRTGAGIITPAEFQAIADMDRKTDEKLLKDRNKPTVRSEKK